MVDYFDLDKSSSIPAAFYHLVDTHPTKSIYAQALINPKKDSLDKKRKWFKRNGEEVEQRVNKIANYLKSVGTTKGSKIAILSAARPEWMEADIAGLAIGGVSVSIYHSLPWEDVGYILYDSDTEVVFTENQEQVDKVLRVLDAPIDIPPTEDREAHRAQIALKKIITFEEASKHDLVVSLQQILSESSDARLDRYTALTRNDLAALVYTSGTTGPPKGVMQTHGNHLANVRQAHECDIYHDNSTIMMFLPLAHSFAKLMGYIGFLTPVELKFPGIADQKTSKVSPESVTKDIREAGSEIIPLVPRLLEKMQAGILEKQNHNKLLSLCLKSTEKVYHSQLLGDKPTTGEIITYKLTGFIRKKIKKQLFGSNFKSGISGGAKLPKSVAYFFDSLGIEILEGYGLTETCVATNVNRLGTKKIGTVGPVLAEDIELRLTEEKEIIFKGPNISLGYYKRDTATKGAWDSEGWFHTGDLGSLDVDGFLTIEGRQKEIIVTTNGKNIPPSPIEQTLSAIPLISQVVLIGDDRPFLIALFTLNPPTIASWAESKGIKLNSHLAECSELRAEIKQAVQLYNESVPNFERVRDFDFVDDEFTVENGMLTPTFKVKRRTVLTKYNEIIDKIYNRN